MTGHSAQQEDTAHRMLALIWFVRLHVYDCRDLIAVDGLTFFFNHFCSRLMEQTGGHDVRTVLGKSEQVTLQLHQFVT
jgi:hypothetical protein